MSSFWIGEDRCKGCPGKCPENCECCCFLYCKKPVDFALVNFHIEKDYYDNDFMDWFKEYFKYVLY